MNASVASQSKRRAENCPGRYSRGLKNRNGEHLVNPSESNILKTQAIFLTAFIVNKYPELYFRMKVQITLT